MLKFYLTTVVIWMIIIESVTSIFSDAIKKKSKKEETKKANIFKRLGALFTLAAIPFFRLFVVIVIVYIATCKQEDFDEIMKKANDK